MNNSYYTTQEAGKENVTLIKDGNDILIASVHGLSNEDSQNKALKIINALQLQDNVFPETSFIRNIDVCQQTGGGLENDVVILKSDHVIVISEDLIGIYKNEESRAQGIHLSMVDIFKPTTTPRSGRPMNGYLLALHLGVTVEAASKADALNIVRCNVIADENATVTRVEQIDIMNVQTFDSEGNVFEPIEIGDVVNVPDPDPTDLHQHAFSGTVKGFRENGNAIVEDQESNSFEIEVKRLTLDEED